MIGAVDKALPSDSPIGKTGTVGGVLRIRIILIALIVMIVALIVGMIVINFNQKNKDDSLGLSIEGLREMLLGTSDINEIIDICQNKINYDNDETEAGLLDECSRFIMGQDSEKEYGELVLQQLIRVDEISQNINSAVGVMNAAAFYEKKEIEIEYYEIMNRRSFEDETNQDIETVGYCKLLTN